MFTRLTCLVTGGAGFIGSHLARKLVLLGNRVIVADNLSSGKRKNIADMVYRADFKFLAEDLRVWSNFQDAAENVDAIFHLAANMGGIEWISNIGAEIMHDNLLMNINFLEACRKYDVEHALYSSSACIYPAYKQSSAEVVPLKESDAVPAEPDQFYGWEKLATEKMCEAYNKDYGLKVRVLRYHNIFGPYSSYGVKGKAPMMLIYKAINHPNPPFEIWGDGLQTRSFCYIDDAIEGTLLRMRSDYLEPLNIGSDRLVTINELARMIIAVSGKDITPLYDLEKPQGVRGRNADLTLAKETLGWEPKITLEEGIKRTYEWLLRELSQ